MVVHEAWPALALSFAGKIMEKRLLRTKHTPCVARIPTEFADMFLVVMLLLNKEVVHNLCEVSTELWLHFVGLCLFFTSSGITAWTSPSPFLRCPGFWTVPLALACISLCWLWCVNCRDTCSRLGSTVFLLLKDDHETHGSIPNDSRAFFSHVHYRYISYPITTPSTWPWSLAACQYFQLW
jgi:hypothetical protein